MITEMFFLGYVHDVQFCPVSISYECITEEHLYLFELLGLPKPKESLKVSGKRFCGVFIKPEAIGAW